MEVKDITIKEIKGFSSAYPNICDLKLLPNIDGTWITIQDNVGTSMTVKLSDLSNFIKTDVLDKIRTELIQSIQNGMLKIEGGNEELFRIIDKYKAESEVNNEN